MAVIGDGLAVTQAAEKVGVSRQTMHAWLARYEAEGLNDRSHRPLRCPHQMPAEVETLLLELRRSHRYWGPRRLVRQGADRHRRPLPDVCVGEVDGPRTHAPGLLGAAPSSAALWAARADPHRQRQGVHRTLQPSAGGVLFDRICRENGIEHLLTQPRSPSTTGNIERFHRTLRDEFLSEQRPFRTIAQAQQALDEWVGYYNTEREHRSIGDLPPAHRFSDAASGDVFHPVEIPADRTGDQWVKVCANGIVCVAWQQVSVGRHRAGERCDVHVDGDILRFWTGNELVKTAARTSTRAVRKKRASTRGPRPQPITQSVKDQPKQIRQASTDTEQPHVQPSLKTDGMPRCSSYSMMMRR